MIGFPQARIRVVPSLERLASSLLARAPFFFFFVIPIRSFRTFTFSFPSVRKPWFAQNGLEFSAVEATPSFNWSPHP